MWSGSSFFFNMKQKCTDIPPYSIIKMINLKNKDGTRPCASVSGLTELQTTM